MKLPTAQQVQNIFLSRLFRQMSQSCFSVLRVTPAAKIRGPWTFWRACKRSTSQSGIQVKSGRRVLCIRSEHVVALEALCDVEGGHV